MDNFGDKLRSVRELQGLSLEELALATQIDGHHLLALESDDPTQLPDDDTIRDYLRVCAEQLGVDPEMMIEDFDRDHDSREAQPGDEIEVVVERTFPVENPGDAPNVRAEAEVQAEPAIQEAPDVQAAPEVPAFGTSNSQTHGPAAPSGSRFPLVGIAIGTVAVFAVIGWWISSRNPAATTAPRAPVSTPRETAAIPEPAPQRIEAAAVPTPQPVQSAAGLTSLSIPDYGVGTAVKDRQLVGAADSFTEGTRVWFWTRVRGAAAGDTIEHVWLREGAEMARVPLRIGGSHWRTQSSKQFAPGWSGDWAVEAQDASGNVLARTEFAVVP